MKRSDKVWHRVKNKQLMIGIDKLKDQNQNIFKHKNMVVWGREPILTLREILNKISSVSLKKVLQMRQSEIEVCLSHQIKKNLSCN